MTNGKQINNSTKYAKYAVQLSRKDLKILVGLFTGHNTLNRHLTLLKIEEDPMCHLCGEEYDTSLHLLGRCGALIEKRRKQFGNHLLFQSELSLLKTPKGSSDLKVKSGMHWAHQRPQR